MSRSYCTYNEDWQRRKSILIRSLFHDIPILSPVPEESTESVLLNPTEAITDTYHHLIEDDDRPESPLPPLIIERAPNRHDEPEQYYEQLLKKIKRIYKKLFIENRDLSPEDLNSISNDSSMSEVNFEMTTGDFNNVSVGVNIALNDEEDNGNVDSTDNNRESSNSFNSNGYVADLESSSTGEWIDVENCIKSNENIRYEEEEEITNELGVNDNENDNDVGNGRLINEIEEANNGSDYLDLMEIEEELNHSVNAEKMCESENSNRIKVNEEEYSQSQDFCDDIIEERELNDNVQNKYNDIGVYYQDNNGKTSIVENFENNGKESELISHFDELEEDAEKTSSIDDYRQITTQALVHVDGIQDPTETESRVYEDSIKSIILPTRQIPIIIDVRRINVDDEIQKLSSPEDNEDPDTTTLESVESNQDAEPIEVMRTPHPRISHESIPTTAPSKAEITPEYTRLPDPTSPVNITSTLEYFEEKNITEAKTSNEINNLTLILSNSQNEGVDSPVVRKRKLHEDAAVQTSQKVAWDELRGNFFVGSPKVFRLCACVEHICRNR